MKLKQLHSEQNERVNTGHSDSTSPQMMVAVWRETLVESQLQLEQRGTVSIHRQTPNRHD